MADTPTEQQTDIIQAMLPHVPFDGWSKTALKMAAQDVGTSYSIAKMLFPDVPGDLIEAYVRLSDAEMLNRLPDDFETLKVREKVTACVRIRMEIAGENEEATRLAVRAFARPRYTARAAQSAWKTADVIWGACGDTATDYNRYTKRGILSGVYSSTLLYWLQDTSDGKQDSWGFLDRRIAGVMRFEKVKARVVKMADKMPFAGRSKEAA
ncbi:MAG: COQ9 family protein [Sphingomonadales bacterium]